MKMNDINDIDWEKEPVCIVDFNEIDPNEHSFKTKEKLDSIVNDINEQLKSGKITEYEAHKLLLQELGLPCPLYCD